MQYITIESSVKSTWLWKKWTRLLLGFILIAFGFSYLSRAIAGDLTLYYSLSVLAFVCGVLSLIQLYNGPFLKANGEELQFKVSMKDAIHRLSWDQLSAIRFDNRIIRFETDKGDWPVHFNCSKENFGAIKKVLRHYANQRHILIEEKEA